MSVTKRRRKRALILRRHPTESERLLRKYLTPGFSFEKPRGRYIVDFYHAQTKLAVEVDGPIHGTSVRRYKDALREETLRNLGDTVIRVTNDNVLTNPVGAAQWILACVEVLKQCPYGIRGGRQIG